MKKGLFVLLFLTFGGSTLAQQIHTSHNVTSNRDSDCEIAGIQESGAFFFVQADKKTPLSDFVLKPYTSMLFYLVLDFAKGVNFNMRYALTCTLKDGAYKQSPSVSFIVGANGPAQPDVHVLKYYEASGNYTVVPNVGENYNFIFP